MTPTTKEQADIELATAQRQKVLAEIEVLRRTTPLTETIKLIGSMVLGALARRRSDRRQWPRQAVVDRWQGMDVLACGHLRTAERQYSLPRARRCPDCPSATPAGQFRVLAEDKVLDAFAALSDEERGAVLTAWFHAQGHGRDDRRPPAPQDDR